MKSIRTLLFALAVLVFGIVTGCSPASDTSLAVPAAVAPMHDLPADGLTIELVREPPLIGSLVMEDLEGRRLSSNDWQGKVVLVVFWATWCGPCREEIPDLIALQDRYPDHLQVIGVSADESGAAKVAEFGRQWHINYPLVMETAEIRKRFPGAFALPTTFVVDALGRMVDTHVGVIPVATLEHEIRYLASLPTAVEVERVESTPFVRLVNAAHATQIPGIDLSGLTPELRELALQRLNEDVCPCGCDLTLAQCRINDAECGVSLPVAKRLLAGLESGL